MNERKFPKFQSILLNEGISIVKTNLKQIRVDKQNFSISFVWKAF